MRRGPDRAKRLVIGPFLIAVAVGVVLLTVVQIAVGTRDDPLYTDLTGNLAYAKVGFDPSYAGLTDVGTVDWDLIAPPPAGPIVMSDLAEPADYRRYGPFSPANRDIVEFTIVIPFMVGEQAAAALDPRASVYPVLHFASIGENWEIFLNGHSVARQIALDDAGRISQFRNLRDLTVPVDRGYVRVGRNVLVIHILGAYSSKWTGLRYASPYYLGSASPFNDYQTISNMIMCVLFAFTGLLHLLFFAFRRTDRYNTLFVGFTVIVAAYYYLETQAVYSLVPDTAFGQRLDYAAMNILVFAGVGLFETVTTGRVTRITAAYGVFGIVAATVQWFFPVWFAYDVVSLWRYVTIAYMVWVVAYDLVWRVYQAVMADRQAGSPGFARSLGRYLTRTETGNIDMVLVLVGLLVIVDIVDIAVFSVNLPLKGYGLLGFTMTMAFLLARKYAVGPNTAAVPGLAEGTDGLVNIGLTPREMDVALLMVSRTSRREIGRKLGLDPAEVARCELAIRGKLGLADTVDPVLAGVATQYRLTKREIEMLAYLRDGVPTRVIATELFISEGTVRSHVSSLLAKLGIAARGDVAGWLEGR